jgi:hypothetical protein
MPSKGKITMKSGVRTFFFPAVSTVSERPLVTTDPKRNQRTFRFKKAHLLVVLGLMAPMSSFASSPYCIAVDGGFGNGGTTFIGSGFALPADGKCSPWAGFTKTASSVIFTTTGTGCVSSDGKALTVSVTSADPAFFNIGQLTADYIQLTRSDAQEPFSGVDFGAFAGGAKPVTCTNSLVNLPSTHD